MKFEKQSAYGAPDETVGYYVEYAHQIINFFDENDKILRNILESEDAGGIINVIVIENLKDTKKRLCESVEKGLKLYASVDTTAAMLVGGVAVAVLNWFQSGRPSSKEELIKDIRTIIEMGEMKK